MGGDNCECIEGLLLVKFGKVGGNHLIGDRVVLEVALDEGLVRRHVDKSVAGEVEEDNFLLASLLALVGLTMVAAMA